MMHGPVGENPQQKILSLRSRPVPPTLHPVLLHGADGKRSESLVEALGEARVPKHVGKIGDAAANVAWPQSDQRIYGRRKAPDAQRPVQKNRANWRTVEQILQIAPGTIEFNHVTVQFRVQRLQRLIEFLVCLGQFPFEDRAITLPQKCLAQRPKQVSVHHQLTAAARRLLTRQMPESLRR